MKKLLIFYNEEELKPIGGPSGYLYSLNMGLKNNKSEKVDISFLHSTTHLKSIKKSASTSKNIIVKQIYKIYKRCQHIRDILRIIYCCQISPINFEEFDAIHFHSTRDLYVHRKQLEHYKGNVILTSHSPQPLYNEYLEGSSKIELHLFGKVYTKLKEMDEYAFERANQIIFPCQTADEPYEKTWKKYREIKKTKTNAFKYLLTGTVPANVRYDKEAIRKKYGIPNKAFLISYVGRHNAIKGYDNLKKICANLLEKNPNIYVLVAGNIGPIEPLKHERWIEAGWTNDPHSLIAASDVFVLPNKETYFDLVLLEVLSIGTPSVITKTGGNRFFERYHDNGVFLYGSFEECEKYIYEIMESSEEKKEKMIQTNKDLYESKFTTDIFAQNYLKLIEDILCKETIDE